MVALPDAEDALSMMVLGAVKFWLGVPKLQEGTSWAPVGMFVSAVLNVIVPAKPPVPVAVIRQDPDCPGEEIVIVDDAQPGETLNADPTVTVTGCETLAW